MLSGSRRLESEEDTREFANELARDLKAGMVVGLIGPLGVGKTTLVRFISKALGAREEVCSPSYVLEHEYHACDGVTIEHWDLYRLNSLPEDLLEPPGAGVLRLIEWIDRDDDFAARVNVIVRLGFGSDPEHDDERWIEIAGKDYSK